MNDSIVEPVAWLLFVYRAPTEPSSSRVAIWRDLKRIGASYLQQCVCLLPDRPDLRAELEGVRQRVQRLGGSSNLFYSPALADEEQNALIQGFRDLVARQYAEIAEECETKFVKEIEFEHFRRNYSFAEAEEIEQDLEKIKRWLARVRERDWFAAPGRDEVEHWLGRCTDLLDDFFAAVHAHTEADAAGPDVAERAAYPVRPAAPAATGAAMRRRQPVSRAKATARRGLRVSDARAPAAPSTAAHAAKPESHASENGSRG